MGLLSKSFTISHAQMERRFYVFIYLYYYLYYLPFIYPTLTDQMAGKEIMEYLLTVS